MTIQPYQPVPQIELQTFPLAEEEPVGDLCYSHLDERALHALVLHEGTFLPELVSRINFISRILRYQTSFVNLALSIALSFTSMVMIGLTAPNAGFPGFYTLLGIGISTGGISSLWLIFIYTAIIVNNIMVNAFNLQKQQYLSQWLDENGRGIVTKEHLTACFPYLRKEEINLLTDDRFFQDYPDNWNIIKRFEQEGKLNDRQAAFVEHITDYKNLELDSWRHRDEIMGYFNRGSFKNLVREFPQILEAIVKDHKDFDIIRWRINILKENLASEKPEEIPDCVLEISSQDEENEEDLSLLRSFASTSRSGETSSPGTEQIEMVFEDGSALASIDKEMLMKESPVLNRIFSGKDSNKIPIQEPSTEVLLPLIQTLNIGESYINIENFPSIFSAASKYLVERVIVMCIKFFAEHIEEMDLYLLSRRDFPFPEWHEESSREVLTTFFADFCDKIMASHDPAPLLDKISHFFKLVGITNGFIPLQDRLLTSLRNYPDKGPVIQNYPRLITLLIILGTPESRLLEHDINAKLLSELDTSLPWAWEYAVSERDNRLKKAIAEYCLSPHGSSGLKNARKSNIHWFVPPDELTLLMNQLKKGITDDT